VVVHPFDQGFPTVVPGASFHLEGAGFVPGPVMVSGQMTGVSVHALGSALQLEMYNQILGSGAGDSHFVGDGTGVPDSQGEIHLEIIVPDWPGAWYAIEVVQQHPTTPCATTLLIHIDQPEASGVGACSIQILGIAGGDDLPWFLQGEYVTYGAGFTPGEIVVLSLGNAPGFDPLAVMAGPAGPVADDGTFVLPLMPPNDDFETTGPAEWWARTPSCEAMTVLGTAPQNPGGGEFTITHEVLAGGGIVVSPGVCQIVVYEEHLDPVPGVDPAYQTPVNETFLAVFGTGFSPGSAIGFLVDGTPLDSTTIPVDDSGRFYAGASALPLYALYGSGYLTNQADAPFVLTAVGDVCVTSAQYVEVAPGASSASPEVATPQVTIAVGPGAGVPEGDGSSFELLVVALVGLGAAGLGFGGGMSMARWQSTRVNGH
jgi:hypothetical protein